MKIVVTGPECSGKSSLAAELANFYQVAYLQEPARAYLRPGVSYQPSDLLALCEQQLALEKSNSHNPLILDTDIQNLVIWWQEKYGPIPNRLVHHYLSQNDEVDRFYLLCRPDLPWEFDPLRENPEDRDRLFDLYRKDLCARKMSFVEIIGKGHQRLDMALEYLQNVAGITTITEPAT